MLVLTLTLSIKIILAEHLAKNMQNDWNKILLSIHHPTYKFFLQNNNNYNYLSGPSPLYIKRLTAQLRTANSQYLYLYVNNSSHTIKTDQMCTICNQQANECLEHIIFDCPLYAGLRNTVIGRRKHSDDLDCLLNSNDLLLLKQLHSFISGAMKIRSFIIND